MQKLLVELKNAPRDTSLVPCSASPALNREETLSVRSRVLANNIPEENQRLPAGGLKATTPVYVLNQDSSPLMPCKPAKARHLLKEKRAKVVRSVPFTIQLLWSCESNTQPITLGIDTGYSNIGFSAVTGQRELISGEAKLRADVSKKLAERQIYRRGRRNKLWYREPRFLNRKKGEGWLAPSTQHKLDSHLKLIAQIKQLLPIAKVVVEVAAFDTQKMQNPKIKSIEYQQGELQGYEVREYLLQKWERKCAYCGKTNIPLEVEHIVPSSRGGSNRVSNLTISCTKCNLKKGSQTAEEFGYPNIQKQAQRSLTAIAFMNIVRWQLVNKLLCGWTYGYITKHNRIKLGLEKSHVNDAFVIASGVKQGRSEPYGLTQTRRNNRSVQTNRKGFKPSVRRERYKLQPHDLVKYKGLLCRVKGVFSYGKWVRIVTKMGEVISTNIKNVEMLKYGKGIQWE